MVGDLQDSADCADPRQRCSAADGGAPAWNGVPGAEPTGLSSARGKGSPASSTGRGPATSLIPSRSETAARNPRRPLRSLGLAFWHQNPAKKPFAFTQWPGISYTGILSLPDLELVWGYVLYGRQIADCEGRIHGMDRPNGSGKARMLSHGYRAGQLSGSINMDPVSIAS